MSLRNSIILLLDVWPIDSTHLKLIETDSVSYLEGDAFDTAQGPFAAGGLLTSDGSGSITAGLEDVNDEGDIASAPNVTGSFTSSGPRSVLTLNGIYNGSFPNYTAGTGNYTFAAYPFNGGVMMLEIDNGAGSSLGVSSGTIYPQTATSLASSQGYGLNLSGANNNGEVDMIAEFTANGDTMTGLYDVNNSGWLVSDASLGNGTFSVASNGRGTLSFPSLQTNGNSMISALNMTFYVVDSSTIVFLETDTDQISTGAFELQNASSVSPAAQARFIAMHPVAPAARVLPSRK